MKHDDGTVFGPISFEQLKQWALDAQVSPLDKVSNDGQTWIKAPMVPELSDGLPHRGYRRTNTTGRRPSARVREFLQMGEINGDTMVTNCRDGSAARSGIFPNCSRRGGRGSDAAGADEHSLQSPAAHSRTRGGADGRAPRPRDGRAPRREARSEARGDRRRRRRCKAASSAGYLPARARSAAWRYWARKRSASSLASRTSVILSLLSASRIGPPAAA